MFTTTMLLSRVFGRLGTRSLSVSSPPSAGTLNSQEVDKFNKMIGEWWDANGPAKALHSMNDIRVPLIRDGLINTKRVDAAAAPGPEPLSGLRILDVGCGGGILTERLARMGANVVGLDAAQASIDAAEAHLAKDPVGCTFEVYL